MDVTRVLSGMKAGGFGHGGPPPWGGGHHRLGRPTASGAFPLLGAMASRRASDQKLPSFTPPAECRPRSARFGRRARLLSTRVLPACLLAVWAVVLIRTAFPTPAPTPALTWAAHGAGPAERKPERRVVLGSHNRLFWVNVDTMQESTIHEGQGVYYGVFPGPAHPEHGATLWVVSRPHNHHPTTAVERLLNVVTDPPDGRGIVLREVAIPSRFAHDAVLHVESNTAFVASTEDGGVLELDAETMQIKAKHERFTRRDHVNTLSPVAGTTMWVMLHRMGQASVLKRIDVDTGRVHESWSNFGKSSHGAVQARNGKSLFVLDSGGGALLRLDPPDASSTEPDEDGNVTPQITVLWRDPKRTFLKGLCVIEGVAYLGLSEFGSRADRASMDKTADLVAVRVADGQELFRKTVQSKGLLNIIAAPQLNAASTYRELSEWSAPSARIASDTTERESTIDIGTKIAYAQLLNGANANIARSFVGFSNDDERLLSAASPFVSAGHVPEALLRPIDTILDAHPEFWDEYGPGQEGNAQFVGRSSNIAKFKPGVATIYLMFSDRSANTFYSFPFEKRFHAAVYPILEHLIAPALRSSSLANASSTRNLLHHICRMQLSHMSGNATIATHADKGNWAKKSHRLHVPLHTHDGVHFEVLIANTDAADKLGAESALSDSGKKSIEVLRVPTQRGVAFEINNLILHRVSNMDPEAPPRIHLIIDWVEQPHPYTVLREGARCTYNGDFVECPPHMIHMIENYVPVAL